MYSPELVVISRTAAFVALCVMTTCAPGTAAPEESVTTPVMFPRSVCATRQAQAASNRAKRFVMCNTPPQKVELSYHDPRADGNEISLTDILVSTKL